MTTATHSEPARKAARPLAAPPSSDREEVREVRKPLRHGEAYGRDGKLITRADNMSNNPFDIPKDILAEVEADGYVLQWGRTHVVGQEDRSAVTRDWNGGWRPVEADRWPGRMMPIGHKGPIETGGQTLYERPLKLQQEALHDESRAAWEKKKSQSQQFGMNIATPGYETAADNKAARQNTGIKRSVEMADPSLAPRHEISVSD